MTAVIRTTNPERLLVPCPTCHGAGEVRLSAVENAVCAACGAIFRPTRRPRADQRHYCPACGRAAATRRASEDYRRRRQGRLPTSPIGKISQPLKGAAPLGAARDAP